jgi:hypothetical protein
MFPAGRKHATLLTQRQHSVQHLADRIGGNAPGAKLIQHQVAKSQVGQLQDQSRTLECANSMLEEHGWLLG